MFSYSTNCTHCGKCVVGKVSTCFRCATEGPPKPFTNPYNVHIKGFTRTGFSAVAWPSQIVGQSIDWTIFDEQI